MLDYASKARTHMNIFTRENSRAVGMLLEPSWLSGLVAVVGGLIVTVGVLLVFAFNSTVVQQQVLSWEHSHSQTELTATGQVVPPNVKPTLASTWPLLIVWGAVGLLVYFIMMTIVHAISEAKFLKDSLEYVNARPNMIIEKVLEHTALRLIAAVILILLIRLFVRDALPYSITAAHVASDTHSLRGILYEVLSFASVTFMLQLLTVFLRLSFGKARIFSR